MNRLGVALLAALAVLIVAPAAHASAPSWDLSGSYSQTFDDEFSATAVNTAVWEEGWFLGHGVTGISPPDNATMLNCYDSSHVTEPGDGFLHLLLSNQSAVCGGKAESYTGALVDTRQVFSQQGGEFEARVQIPSVGTRAAGWPGWWQNGPAAVSWPKHGEIDTVEGLSGSTAAHLHYVDSGGVAQGPGCTSATPKVGWHTFGEAWSVALGSVTFYWDGVRLCSHAFLGPYAEYLVAEYSIGSGSPVPAFPSDVLLDWVRVWR